MNTCSDKDYIAEELKHIPFRKVVKEWNTICSMTAEEISDLSGRSMLGCAIVDYYFFKDRLETVGIRGINFFEFIENLDFYKEKKYVKTLLDYCEKTNRYKESHIRKYYYCFGLCFGRINAFKITNVIDILNKYPECTHILDPFAGFGGRMLGAIAKGLHYTGIDTNVNLKTGYDKIFECPLFFTYNSRIIYDSCENVDFSTIHYDTVFTSPIYYNIEVYSNMRKRKNKEWDEFYKNTFTRIYAKLQENGLMIININEKIYNKILVPLFGTAHHTHILKKSEKNKYVEYIYVWRKDSLHIIHNP